MEWSENAIKVYKKLYFDKRENPDNPEDITYLETDPTQVHRRISVFIANNLAEEKAFLNLLNNNIFRPNTPCMIHAGLDKDNLCACFVMPLEDSMESIIQLWAVTAKIYASGAGAGFRITKLREKGSPLSTGGVASGPIAYLAVNECVSNTVKAGGKHRRAANMGVFDYNHPDTLDIIKAKENGDLSAFNLSMLVDNFFMDNVKKVKAHNEDKEIIKGDFVIPLRSPNKIVKTDKFISGMKIWDTVVDKAWRTGDPGLLFLENVNISNPFKNSRGLITATNPCGEVPLFDGTSCNLGSINFNAEIFEDNAAEFGFDWIRFSDVVRDAVHFLDNVIDKTEHIHPIFEKNMKELRPIGLGGMGFCDLLIKKNIEYGGQESIEFFELLCQNLTYNAMRTSLDMCKNEGKEPIHIPMEDYDAFIDYLKYYGATEEDINDFVQYGIRNFSWTCFAPTGSISISCDCLYSFEPTPAIIWQKELAETKELMNFLHPEFEKWYKQNFQEKYKDKPYVDYEESVQKDMEEIINNNGSVKGLYWVPEDVQKRFRVAHDINPMRKLKLQAAGQRWITMGISSTCNLPNSATKEDVENIFITAYELGLKGITIYRDGCKENQPINFGRKEKILIDQIDAELPPDFDFDKFKKTWLDISASEVKINYNNKPVRRKRPIRRTGETFEIKTPHGKLFPRLNMYPDKKPMEIFIDLGGAGSHESLAYAILARAISTGLQYGIDVREYIGMLRDAREVPFRFKVREEDEVSIQAESIFDALGIIMENYFIHENEKPKEGLFPQIEKEEPQNDTPMHEKCPECGYYTLTHTSGCRGGYCLHCNYTTC